MDGGGRSESGTELESNAGSNCREDPATIKKILTHLDQYAPSAEPTPLPRRRREPAGSTDPEPTRCCPLLLPWRKQQGRVSA